MCDPVSATIAVTTAATAGANHLSQKALTKEQTRQSNRTAALSGREFDTRMGLVRGSDTRVDDLLQRQYRGISGVEDETFQFLLDNNRGGFDEQLDLDRSNFDLTHTIAGDAFNAQLAALQGMITTQRQARLEKQAFTEAEEKRQKAIQDRADQMAEALPGEVGFDAQQLAYGDALDRRTEFAKANMTAPSGVPVNAEDPVIASLFGRASEKAYGDALTTATSDAGLASYGDAFAASNRKLSTFASDIDRMTRQAATSREPLTFEQAIAEIVRRNATEAYEFQSDMLGRTADMRINAADRYADRRGGAMNDYRVNSGEARRDYATNYGSALSNFYDRSLGSESIYTDRLMGSSRDYESKAVNLGNWRMQNTRPNTLLSDLVDVASAAYGGYAKNQAQKKSIKNKTGGKA